MIIQGEYLILDWIAVVKGNSTCKTHCFHLKILNVFDKFWINIDYIITQCCLSCIQSEILDWMISILHVVIGPKSLYLIHAHRYIMNIHIRTYTGVKIRSYGTQFQTEINSSNTAKIDSDYLHKIDWKCNVIRWAMIVVDSPVSMYHPCFDSTANGTSN